MTTRRSILPAARWVARVPVDLAFLLLGALVGASILALVVTAVFLLASGSALALVPVLLLAAASVRLLMMAERLRLLVVGRRFVPYPVPPPNTGFVRFIRFFVGPLDGRQAAYLLLLGPVGAIGGTLCALAWVVVALGLADVGWTLWPITIELGEPGWLRRLLAAAVLLPLAAAGTRLLAAGEVRLAEELLGASERRRVEVVLASRARAVDAQTAELRRIERDLHDGAQARLVALTMQLGLVGRALRPLGDEAGLARAQLEGAVSTVNAALADLRHLVRGIHPPVLADRGLTAAVTALAADCAIPVDLALDEGERLAPAVEAAAYFTVAEALANAAKHAAASRCRVTMHRADGVLSVSVIDDGRGGADPGGAGLAGLRHRIEALDGQLTVTSPGGGPTTVKAELPCG
jgi:signal transduction histidine kinase